LYRITQKMKVHSDEELRQKIMREIIHVNNCIEQYRNNKSCLYLIFMLDTTRLSELQKRLKKLCAEYKSLVGETVGSLLKLN
jgi:hypothetical protein